MRLSLLLRGIRPYGRALQLVWESGRAWTCASIALVLVQAVLPLLALYLMKLVVDAVVGAVGTPDKSAALSRIVMLVAAAGLVALAAAACRALATFVSEAHGQLVTDRVLDRLHAKSIDVDLERFESARYRDALERAQQEGGFRPTRVLHGLLQVTQSGISFLALAGLLLSLSWSIALVLVAAAIPGLLLRARHAGRTYQWQREQTPLQRRAWYFHWMLTGVEHAKEIRLFDLGSVFRQRYRDTRAGLRREQRRFTARRSGGDLVAQASLIVAVFGTYAFIAYRTVLGAITIGDLVMYFQAFQRGHEFLRELLSGLAGLYEDRLFLSNIYEFLDLERTVVEPRTPKSVPRPLRSGIVFEHVSFRYPGTSRTVLHDISLGIEPGETVALVGDNGSGKTTLVKLLCRLYDPTSGVIRLDGIDIRDFAASALRRELGVIFQDYARYQLSARENIWLGDVDAPMRDDRVVQAARRSGADGVIGALTHGYETTLGTWFEHAHELSIGEWQKVALARAFMRDAQIVVLDEPTSALDAKAEYEVFERFRRLTQGRTAILISHRLSTVKMADRIYVLADGRIVESGTHDALMRSGGRYEQLFELQAQHYR